MRNEFVEDDLTPVGVQRGCRFVARISSVGGQRAGDRDALALPAERVPTSCAVWSPRPSRSRAATALRATAGLSMAPDCSGNATVSSALSTGTR